MYGVLGALNYGDISHIAEKRQNVVGRERAGSATGGVGGVVECNQLGGLLLVFCGGSEQYVYLCLRRAGVSLPGSLSSGDIPAVWATV